MAEAVTATSLARETECMLQQDRLHDALGIYWLGGVCPCGVGARDFSIVTVRPGLQLHYCGMCGRSARPNRERVLGTDPWESGDLAVLDGDLVMLLGAPGPTGDLRVAKMDEPGVPISTHVALLNLED